MEYNIGGKEEQQSYFPTSSTPCCFTPSGEGGKLSKIFQHTSVSVVLHTAKDNMGTTKKLSQISQPTFGSVVLNTAEDNVGNEKPFTKFSSIHQVVSSYTQLRTT